MSETDTKKEEKHKISSKYELTLAEFPIFNLPALLNSDDVSYIHKDKIKINGQKLERTWEVIPSPKFGFGFSTTLGTLFELHQMWKEMNYESQTLRFKISDILERKNLSAGGKNYENIKKDIKALKGITISCLDSFWDNKEKTYVTIDEGFSIIDNYRFVKKKKGDELIDEHCMIKFSDIMFDSVKKDSLLTTNFDSMFFHKLAPKVQQAALYISKVLKMQSIHKKEVDELASQLGVGGKEKKTRKLSLKRIFNDLIEHNHPFLEKFYFEKGSPGKEYLVSISRYKKFKKKLPEPQNDKKADSGDNQSQLKKQKIQKVEVDSIANEILTLLGDKQSINFYRKIAWYVPYDLIYRAMSIYKADTIGQKIKNKGAYFTAIIKKIAHEAGINL